jgi:outer membrane protein
MSRMFPTPGRPHRFSFSAVILLVATLIAAGCTTTARRALTGPAPVPASPATAVLTPAIPPRAPAPPAAPAELFAPGSRLSLEQVIDLALANNPLTRVSYRQARSARLALRAARGAFLPTVDLTATYWRGQQSSEGRDVDPTSNYGPGLTLNYLLLDFGARAGAAEEGRQALLAADWNHNAQVQNVVWAAQTAYFRHLGSRSLTEAATTSLKQAQTALAAANTRHDAGVATISDVLLAKTAVSQAELQLQRYEGLVMTTRGSLATAMGFSATLPVEVGALPSDLPVDALTETIDGLVQTADRRRPDLQAARALAEKANLHVSTVRSDLLPALTLQANLNRTWYDPFSDFGSRTNWSGRLLLSFPLFSGFSLQANLARAKEDAAAAQGQLDLTTQSVIQQVWTSYYTAITASRQVTTSRDLLASAAMAENVALGRDRDGVGTILDLLTAQAAMADARAQDVQARAGWLIAVATLAHDVGVAPRLDQGQLRLDTSSENK